MKMHRLSAILYKKFDIKQCKRSKLHESLFINDDFLKNFMKIYKIKEKF